jgi:hypothetical protein
MKGTEIVIAAFSWPFHFKAYVSHYHLLDLIFILSSGLATMARPSTSTTSPLGKRRRRWITLFGNLISL